MKIAVAFLTTEVNEGTVDFAKRMQDVFVNRYTADVFIISDSEFSQTAKHDFQILRPLHSVCKNDGYINSVTGTHVNKECCAIDKALWVFCEQVDEYDFVLFIEDDVFIPSVDALIKLIEKSKQYDFVTSKLQKKTNDILDWNWKTALGKIEKEYWHMTMAPVAGFSRRMLNEIKAYATEHKTLFNSEIFWPSLAFKKGLSIFCPPELKTILWQAGWSIDDVMCLPENLFHPYKNPENHSKLRSVIAYAKQNGYLPANKLPLFLKQE